MNKMMRKNNTKMARYLITGGLSFAFEYMVFVLAVYTFGLSAGWGQAVSYSLALIVNFSLLRGWTFKMQSKASVTSHIFKYGALVAFNLPATTLLMNALVDMGVEAFVAKLGVVGCAAVWNYFVYDRLIFKQSLSSEDVI